MTQHPPPATATINHLPGLGGPHGSPEADTNPVSLLRTPPLMLRLFPVRFPNLCQMNKRNDLRSFLLTPARRGKKRFKFTVPIVTAKEGSTIFLLKISRSGKARGDSPMLKWNPGGIKYKRQLQGQIESLGRARIGIQFAWFWVCIFPVTPCWIFNHLSYPPNTR